MQPNKLDTYWRLPESYGLGGWETAFYQDEDYDQKIEHMQAEHADSEHRLARGFLVYDLCETSELRKFYIDRRLLANASKTPRADLIAALMAADDDISFHKFCDLPAELRNRIYTAYVREFHKILECPSQPPLARTSKQLWSEVLPVFYKEVGICISLSHKVPDDRILEIPREAQHLFEQHNFKYLAKAQYLEFHLMRKYRNMYGVLVEALVGKVFITKSDSEYAVSVEFWGLLSNSRDRRLAITQGVQKVLNKDKATDSEQEGRGILDMNAVRVAIEKGFFAVSGD